MGDAALLLGLKPEDHGMHDEGDKSYGGHDEGDAKNHEYDAASGDAFHAARANDMEGFRKGLYNAICAVFDEHEGDEGDDDGMSGG